MRARYYNPDIKRFINQDIKAGDIGNSQSLNRYAYCEGNPVSMVDPFGLCGENTNDQGQKSRYQWLHHALDVVGLFFDGADIVNAALYAYEKDWANAAICAASAIPAVGAAVVGVAKGAKAVLAAKKAEKIASLAAEASKMTKNAANTLDAFSDTMKAVSKWGDNPLKLVDGVTTETASKALKALETGGDFARESQKAVWEMKAVVGADGIRLSTKADEGASLLKHGMAGTDGVAKSAGKGGAASLSKKAKILCEGEKGTVVEVKSYKEADALLKEAFPDYQKVNGIGHHDASEIRKRNKIAAYKKGGTYHKDYAIDPETKRIRGHDNNLHGMYPHINIKRTDGKTVMINIVRDKR